MSLEELQECGHGFENETSPFIEDWKTSEDSEYRTLQIFYTCGECGKKLMYEIQAHKPQDKVLDSSRGKGEQ